jgi:signal transduction histidine kinase
MDELRENVFAEEEEILVRARAWLIEVGEQAVDWSLHYRQLMQDYEKLLKTAVKISRISDIQGRMLKDKEQEVRTANDNLRHIENLRLQLIQDITHELRTPMTTVQGYLEALLDGIVQPDEKYLRMIHNRFQTMNRLINDLFQLDKLKSNLVSFQPVDLRIGDWLEDICGKYAIDASSHGIEFHTFSARHAGQAIVSADPLRIDQVMANLIYNAMRYTPEGAAIRIECDVIGAGEVAARYGRHLSATFKGRQAAGVIGDEPLNAAYAVVQVRDEGPGLNEAELPYLFDRFYRGSQSFATGSDGAGLGLAISKEIIHRHGGQIGAFADPGKGSTFFFTLPVLNRSLV